MRSAAFALRRRKISKAATRTRSGLDSQIWLWSGLSIATFYRVSWYLILHGPLVPHKHD